MIRIFLLLLLAAAPLYAAKPNVILVITDDQGYGDLGAHGNSMIATPNLDLLHAKSVRLTNYHVDPTCSPTRAALMTGRYSTRTGVWHTIMGRSLMRAEEQTLAELFKAAGYATGMFGKWHLGDNFPLRPQDQGFDLAFHHGGGGVGQTPDWHGNDYFDDTYLRNGVPEQKKGYCTNIWFDEAITWIKANRDQPFFTYLSTNAPHGPYFVAPEYSNAYREKGVPGAMAPFYGMIENIDENMGRLMGFLKSEGLEQDTLLIFTSDNGTAAGLARTRIQTDTPKQGTPPWGGFNAGMRGTKGSELEGGHRVPFFLRWPGGGLSGGRDVNALTAHIDVLPTLAALTGIEKPAGSPLDGADLSPLLKNPAVAWPERTLFVHSQRLEHPRKGRKNAVMTRRWRLVNNAELYDMETDPGQGKNVAEANPEVVAKLNTAYDAWWKSLEPSFTEEVRIGLGGAENPARLTCHDWHTNDRAVPWNQGHVRSGLFANGHWAIEAMNAGSYEFTLRRWPEEVDRSLEARHAVLEIGGQKLEKVLAGKETHVTFSVKLDAGPMKLRTELTHLGGKKRGAYFVYVNYTGK